MLGQAQAVDWRVEAMSWEQDVLEIGRWEKRNSNWTRGGNNSGFKGKNR